MIKHTSYIFGVSVAGSLLATGSLVADVKIANKTEMAADRTPDAMLEVKAPDSAGTTSALLVNDGTNFPLFEVQADGRVGVRTKTPAGTLHVRAFGKGFIVNGSGTDYTGNLWNGTASENGVQIGGGFMAVQRSTVPFHVGHATGAAEIKYVNFNFNGAGLGDIRRVGTTGVSYETASDERLKTRIEASKYGLNEVMSIGVYDYNYKAESDKVRTGVLAQDVYRVYPSSVRPGGEDPREDPWTVDYRLLSPLVARALQEQQVSIENLGTRISEVQLRYDSELEAFGDDYTQTFRKLSSEIDAFKASIK